MRAPSISLRRRAAYLLGELRELSPVSLALRDEDWKVRRNAAIALGKIAPPSYAPHLIESLQSEQDERVRVSLILAFGNIAPPASANLLESVACHTDEERKASAKVFDRFRGLSGETGQLDGSTLIPPEAGLELCCRSGLADIVSDEVRQLGLQARSADLYRVRLLQHASFSQLLKIRTALYPLLVFESESTDPASLGAHFSASPVASEMQRLARNDGPIRYRLTLPQGNLQSVRKREWVEQFAATNKNLLNAATGYTWELIVRFERQKTLLGARPAALSDDRFAYRKADVPASIHPTLAAAAARLLPLKPTDTVLDPFCGSGTLLMERALLAPSKYLIGSDIDPKALAAAYTNLGGLPGFSLIRADIASLPWHSLLDVIISNPPYGQRVSHLDMARKLHALLDRAAGDLLRPGGALVVFRPPQFPDPPGLAVSKKLRVDAGGIPVNLIVAQKP